MKRYLYLMYGLYLMIALVIVLPSCKKNNTSDKSDQKKTIYKQDPKVEEVLGKIIKAWENTKSFTATLETELDSAAGGPGHTSGVGKYNLDKKGDITRIHFIIANALTRPMKDDPARTAGVMEKLEFTTDGQILYLAKNVYQNNEVIKSKYNPVDILHLGGKDFMDDIKSKNRLNFLSETYINGKEAILIEAIPHEGNWKILYYFEKTTGLLLKTIERDPGGKETYTMQITEFDPSVKFTDEEFQYKVPDGYTLIDNTKD